jgi:hypothetical protein
MKTFAERLQDCVDKGRLTGADLSIWFNRPYPTVRTWRLGLSEPWHPWREEAEQCLIILERLIHQKELPMPSSYSAFDRRYRIRELVREYHPGLPKTRTA